MKYLVATDIHGSRKSAEVIKEKFEKTKADKIVLLGDLLYHGARNELPETYSPKGVTEILNSLAENIICVKGNCDSEVDQMVLEFQIAESTYLSANGKTYFLTHGHKISHENPGKLAKGTIVLYGHFHRTRAFEIDGVTYVNIASITMPKEGNEKCYAIIDENGLTVYDLDDNQILKV